MPDRQSKKLVLAVIDSLKPDMLDLAIEEGRAPTLASLRERGTYIRDCLSTFPSVTPVASAAIATGQGPGEHHIPSMNWYHRGEERYVEYGSSFQATRAFGVVRSLYDTVYNMNMAHLTRAHKTVFEHLDDAGLRTACTTWLIYRGRTRHDPSGQSVYRRIAEAAQFRHPVYGARELFYADLFDSRNTGCTSALGMPGQRDRHTGCVGAYLVEHDLFDFLLFSLPDNDTHSHKAGPDGQVTLDRRGGPRARADRARRGRRGGVPRAALGDRHVGPLADHDRGRRQPRHRLRRRSRPPALRPGADRGRARGLAGGPLGHGLRARRRPPRRARRRRRGDAARPRGGRPGRDARERGAVVHSRRGELRFAPGGELEDRRGRGWRVEGDHATLDLGGDTYPDALNRLWSALECPHSGDVLASAEPGYEFVDWGGADHVGGGSHGALHRDDSEGVLLLCGVDAPEQEEWALTDVTGLVLRHFGVPLHR